MWFVFQWLILELELALLRIEIGCCWRILAKALSKSNTCQVSGKISYYRNTNCPETKVFVTEITVVRILLMKKNSVDGMVIVHLISLVHGLRAEAKDWDVFSETLVKQFTEKLPSEQLTWIFVSKCNEREKSYEGLEIIGTRFMEEFFQFLMSHISALHEPIQTLYLSFVGHSLGGIIIRYCIPFLFSKMQDKTFSLFSKLIPQHVTHNIIPVTYMSICTPHLGSRRPGTGNWKQKVWKQMVSLYINNLIGKTGKQLYLEDEEQILHQMSKPDSPFIEALLLFQHQTLVSVVHHDMIVPYTSSSIRHHNPYVETPKSKQFQFQIKGTSHHFAKHSHFLSPHFATTLHTVSVEKDMEHHQQGQVDTFHSDSLHHLEYHGSMLKNLNEAVNWRRLDLEFHVTSTRYYFPIHAIPIHKIPKISWQHNLQMYHTAIPSVNCLTQILCHDHFSLNNNCL